MYYDCHSWWHVSLCLWGACYERVLRSDIAALCCLGHEDVTSPLPVRNLRIFPGRIRYRPSTEIHQLHGGRTIWTLCLAGPKVRRPWLFRLDGDGAGSNEVTY